MREPSTARVDIRLTAAEVALLEKAADLEYLTVVAYARRAALLAAEARVREDKE